MNEELYIGTTWGCIIIAEKATLRPITIFRPYEEEVRAIVPLVTYKRKNTHDQNVPLLATIGKGYRSLLTRYTDVNVNNIAGNHLLSPLGVNNFQANVNKQNMFVLLWRAEHWNTN